MSSPTKYPKAQRMEKNRRSQWQVELYEADGTCLELSVGDVVKCKIWDGVDGSTAYVIVTGTATAAGSVITVDDVGDDASTNDPATVTITIEPDDADDVPVDDNESSSFMEITVARAASLTKPSVVCSCVVNVKGSPA